MSYKVQEAEIVVFTSKYGVPLREPELRVLGEGGYVVPLPQATTVKAVVSHNDVSRVEVTLVATLRFEIQKRQPQNLTLFDKEDSSE